MDRDEVTTCLGFLAGHWPTPELSEAELGVWERTLWPLDYATASEVIHTMSASGRAWRPVDGEFVAEYRAARRREPAPEPLPTKRPELPAIPEAKMTREEAIADARKNLGAARGPLAKDFKTIGNDFGLRYPTDSPESRALALERLEEGRNLGHKRLESGEGNESEDRIANARHLADAGVDE